MDFISYSLLPNGEDIQNLFSEQAENQLDQDINDFLNIDFLNLNDPDQLQIDTLFLNAYASTNTAQMESEPQQISYHFRSFHTDDLIQQVDFSISQLELKSNKDDVNPSDCCLYPKIDLVSDFNSQFSELNVTSTDLVLSEIVNYKQNRTTNSQTIPFNSILSSLREVVKIQNQTTESCDDIIILGSTDSFTQNSTKLKRGRRRNTKNSLNPTKCKFGNSFSDFTSEDYIRRRCQNNKKVREFRQIDPNKPMVECPHCKNRFLENGLKRHLNKNKHCIHKQNF